MTQKLKTITLGCKVNQYETEFVREGLLSVGYRDARREEIADLCVVNTCTVTREGEAKSRQMIRRAARENPGIRIVVMGCYATRAPEEVWALPAVSDVVTDKRELPALLRRFGVTRPATGISDFRGRHRAYLKVQDGCMLRCSYCIIPKVRPHVFSRPVDEILAEARGLIDNGYRELILTGVHLGHYGVERNRDKPKAQWVRLSYLVRRLAQLNGHFRIRLSSIEITEVTRELIATMSDFPEKICPHLHICLQSGSDRVLRRMRRRWPVRMFLERCQLIRQSLARPAFSTDVVVGFPGETDDDFQATCNVLREVGFSKIHVFPFSARQGTAAAEMPDQLPKAVKVERGRRIAELEQKLRADYFQTLLGQKLSVLVESNAESNAEDRTHQAFGTSCRYTPVALKSQRGSPAAIAPGQLVECVPDRYDAKQLHALPS